MYPDTDQDNHAADDYKYGVEDMTEDEFKDIQRHFGWEYDDDKDDD